MKKNAFEVGGEVGAKILKTIYYDWPIRAYKRGKK